MSMDKDESNLNNNQTGEKGGADLITRIENAYRIYKLSEVFLNDVESDYGKDYGKLKIARLRLEFARHELFSVLEEAREKGVKWNENEFIHKFFYQSNYKDSVRDIT